MVPVDKLLTLALLGAIGLVFGTAALSIAVIMKERRENSLKDPSIPSSNTTSHTTIPHHTLPFDPSRDLHSHRRLAPDPTSRQLSADAYFAEALRLFGDEYPLGDGGPEYYSYGTNLEYTRRKKRRSKSKNSHRRKLVITIAGQETSISLPFHDWQSFSHFFTRIYTTLTRLISPSPPPPRSSSYTSPSQQKSDTLSDAFYYLEQAATLGNPHAQHALAHVLSTGLFLPSDTPPSTNFSLSHTNQSYAVMLYHMASIAGVVEAQMSLGYRYESSWMARRTAVKGKGKGKSGDGGLLERETYGVEGSCEGALAYYEEAAHAVMDELEGGWGRGKVNPSMDGHLLHEMHKVSNGPNVAQYNKPDEHVEALEYFRLKATSSQGELDISAAFTLAYYYHYGSRGIEQNLALALKYYETAANAGSIEAAGQAATFHLLGIGYENRVWERSSENATTMMLELHGDLDLAYDYATKGAPGGLLGCTQRHRFNNEKEDDCDEDALNALGLLHLVGLEGKVKKNRQNARDLFTLARDMGCEDAGYHLGMLKMGWMKQYKYEDPPKESLSPETKAEAEANVVNYLEETSKAYDVIENWQNMVDESHEDDVIQQQLLDQFHQQTAHIEEELKRLHEFISNKEYQGHHKHDEFIKNFKKVKSKFDKFKDLRSQFNDYAHRKDKNTIDPSAPTEPTKKPKITLLDDTELQRIANAALQGATTAANKKLSTKRPSVMEYSEAVQEFARAGKKGHLQAKHRLGMIHSHGITTIPNLGFGVDNGPPTDVPYSIVPECENAIQPMRDVAYAGPVMARRLRRAYRQYVKGNYEMSLRNYLVAAEAGSLTGQLNAAFLMERGICLRLGREDCLRASLKMWKAAARKGRHDAFLKVGDYYYYNKLEGEEVRRRSVGVWSRVWRYVLYPEEGFQVGKKVLVNSIRQFMKKTKKVNEEKENKEYALDKECTITVTQDGTEETCTTVPAPKQSSTSSTPTPTPPSLSDDVIQDKINANLATAAIYYRHAAEKPPLNRIPQAHFNLGFMHEWGLGLKQDFPLAKRHYDLAASESEEAGIAVAMALWSMAIHERFVRWRVWYDEWIEGRKGGLEDYIEDVRVMVDEKILGLNRTQSDVIWGHVFSWESLLIIILSVVLLRITNRRRRRLA